MRPLNSFTVPPSTIFSSAPVSFYSKAKGKANGMDIDEAVSGPERITAVVLEKGEGITKETKRKVIWAWTGDEEARRTITVSPRLGVYGQSDIQVKEPIYGLHRTANPSYPILAVHSASAFSLIPGTGTKALHAQSSDKTTTEVLASQVIFSSPEHTRCLVLDVTGHWTLVAIENGKSEKQKEGEMTDDKRVLRFASISKDGVITATGTFP
jgi:hypothetical protein